ncbi:MAG: hypothetical protein A2556_00350 [Candidatus Vogelbacteria bacterium RIFOXYD2_FULL_44_9]|uniref:GIY-YIG domain-containing protein n=1 Tax=Candidatus Vogelbacteria bacterium RIFOXYD2_FULL_44_9 TaxID=1802441 RepID=A0A1G2QN23_9BACT|nr:MAG: hypothetical protein A2556_00350 [Candidatus Vogelbacteria bacterium RIFOXYD2_FULL_44_9]
MFYVYILKSQKDSHFYIGKTNNFNRRFKEHNSGKVLSTKSRKPFILLKLIEVETQEESVNLEREYKKGFRREELKKEFGGFA